MTNYARYNAWANTSLINWLQEKPEVDYDRQAPSSYPSLTLTLNHILAVEEFWLSVVCQTTEFNPRYLQADPDHREVFPTLLAHTTELAEYVSGLTEAACLERIHLETPWVQGEMPRYEFLQHVFNHSTYHRGQAVTIGQQLGYTDAPMTDYNFYNMVVLKGA